MLVYAGIGSRETPRAILTEMTTIACQLADHSWTLRSGGARGADSAFASGALARMLEGGIAPLIFPASAAQPHHIEHASRFHPNWPAVVAKGPYVEKLMGRNSIIVLGTTLTQPVNLVICWTPGGLSGGGTGQALRIARHHHIPIIDLYTHFLSGFQEDRPVWQSRQVSIPF